MSSGLCGEAGFDEFGLDKRERRKCARLMFLVGWMMHDPALQNSTVLVLTDRNDLENQLFATVARCRDVLGEEPVQAESIWGVKALLDCEVGGVVFLAIQKFRPDAGGVFP